ncbi:hypothetical protein [Dokdonella sp.]|uniref:hypothetical protein n=1 Tax=Dokdonella sp. TaxID=2291710 RepID=UPI002F3FBFE4
MTAPGLDIREAADGAERARDLFRRHFGDEPPSFPHHVIAFVRDASGIETPASYVHFTPVGELLLGGGACVDRRVMRTMAADLRARIRAQGGLYRMTLDWAVRHFAPTHKAIFGYCGDALAERVDLAAGFRPTGHAHLLVHWTRALADAECARLVAQAHAIGPF